MYKTIEIDNSDDEEMNTPQRLMNVPQKQEMQNQLLQKIWLKSPKSNLNATTSKNNLSTFFEINNRPKKELVTPSILHNTEISTNILHKITNRKNDVEIPTIPNRPPRQNRRKSTHQAVRANPDIQFETLIHNANNESNDGDDGFMKAPTMMLQEQHNSPKEVFNAGFEEFLNRNETLKIIEEIAVERLRINALLALNGMKEINFPLYAPLKSLRMELGERFKAIENNALGNE